MNFFQYLFGNNNEIKLSKSSIRKLARKAGIIYLKSDMFDAINSNYINTSNEYIKKLKKISSHRKGKIIKTSDLNLLIDLNNNKITQNGGNFDGFCDNNIGQCSDSIMCGGKHPYSNIIPKERFLKIVKHNSKKKIKFSKNLLNNLHSLVEKKVNNDLIIAKNKANNQGRKMINLGDLLISL